MQNQTNLKLQTQNQIRRQVHHKTDMQKQPNFQKTNMQENIIMVHETTITRIKEHGKEKENNIITLPVLGQHSDFIVRPDFRKREMVMRLI